LRQQFVSTLDDTAEFFNIVLERRDHLPNIMAFMMNYGAGTSAQPAALPLPASHCNRPRSCPTPEALHPEIFIMTVQLSPIAISFL
jgi:hypothetical protein